MDNKKRVLYRVAKIRDSKAVAEMLIPSAELDLFSKKTLTKTGVLKTLTLGDYFEKLLRDYRPNAVD